MSNLARFRSAADERRKLIACLAACDYAPSELTQLKLYIGELNNRIFDDGQLVGALHAKADKEQAEYEKYRDSRIKRFAYLLGGKKEDFDKQAEKEEKEYWDAVQEYERAQSKYAVLEAELAAAKTKRTELESVVEKRLGYQLQLDTLYNTVFDGSTPDFPGEDMAEDELRHAQTIYDAVQIRLSQANNIVQLVRHVLGLLSSALEYIDTASKQSFQDIIPPRRPLRTWGAPPPNYDSMKRTSLEHAEAKIDEAQQLVILAQTINPEVQMFGQIDVFAYSDSLMAILLDNPISDVFFLEKIQGLRQNLVDVIEEYKPHVEMFERRSDIVHEEWDNATRRLEDARQHLENLRMQALETMEKDN